MSLLEVENISKKYHTNYALQSINFSANPNEVIVLLGPNGSGKSTLFNILAGTVTRYSGHVRIKGERPGPYTKGLVSYLPDRFYLPEFTTPKEAIKLFNDFYGDFDAVKANHLIEVFQLDLKTPVKKMSKGMREKLQIALVMSRRAEVYLLDEPLSGVDPLARHEIINELFLDDAQEALIIIATHLVSEIEPICTRALILEKGHLKLDTDIEEMRMKEGLSLEEIMMEAQPDVFTTV